MDKLTPMDNQNKKWTLLIVLPLIVAVWFSLWYFKTDWRYDTVLSDTGVWNLRSFDFEEESARIRGEVEYIPNVLLTPEEFDQRYDEAAVGRPHLITNVSTSRITILVPDDEYYMIAGSSIDYSDRIFVNGEHMKDVGTPAYTKEESVPDTAFIYFMVKPVDGVVEIVQQTSNYVHKDNGGHTNIAFGRVEQIQQHLAREVDVTAIVMGCFLVLFIVHMTLYLLLRSFRANLWFSLFCLNWFIRTALSDVMILKSIFPDISWYFTFRTMYITGPVAAILLILTLNDIFPGILQKLYMRLVFVVSAAFIAVCLFADTVFMSQIVVVYEVALIAAIVWLIITFARKMRSINTEQVILFSGVAIFLYAAIRDIFYYNDILLAPFLNVSSVEAALIIFVFFQMVSMFLGTVREQQEVRQREKELAVEKESLIQLNTLKEDFLGDLSHELQMPITVVSGFAQVSEEMLTDEQPDHETLKDNMRLIIRESDKLERMVTQLLDAAAIESGKFRMKKVSTEISEIATQIESLHSLAMNENNNAFVIDILPGTPPFHADPERVLQVLINLVSNSAKHTRNGRIVLSSRAEGNELTVSVSDDGEGIAPELIANLFERFPEKRSPAGTGLGLYISKNIVEAHGGTIDINSEPGTGTVVWFTLPIDGEVTDSE